MKQGEPKTIYLQDYTAPAYRVDAVSLVFELGEDATRVTSVANYRRASGVAADAPLELFGENLELLEIRLNGLPLTATDYSVSDTGMSIPNVSALCTLEIVTRIYPQKNTSLEGLYQTSGNFCTQCEAQGFRKITYYPDRPDVMTVFTTQILADKQKYPVLLSNGNLTGSGDLADGRHWARWEDPFQKPAYLFALVAGNLQHVEDHYTTLSGRDVTLRIYTEAHNIDKCDHAMQSLKRAMHWDEQRFGLEYDLDIYMIVAVDDFNMGAMENKGLNVFNSKLVFASPATATDMDYVSIEAVIGHEYFHNWTGNRVTCRDWFQLSLKEGLTVFRDQEFTSDLHSRSVKRIEDVRMLRTHQFAEDASPMAHPIRPSSYMEINNFYTVTVYEKGAEVVRMYQTLLGRDGFRKGMDLYFQRHDGHAVSTENFLAAMADANAADLSQFQRWYDQAGTPDVAVRMAYDAAAQTCTLHFTQTCPATPEAAVKSPFLIPIEVGLLNSHGQDMLGTQVLRLTEAEQTFSFSDVPEQPVPSLLRGFSAPVKLSYPYTAADLVFLMKHDSDAFNRWDAGQRLAMQTILSLLAAHQQQEAFGLEHDFISAYQAILTDATLDHALRAEALTLPSEADIAERARPSDPEAIHTVREFIHATLAKALRLDLETLYADLHAQGQGDYSPDAASIGRRSLKNVCLAYLGRIQDDSIHETCLQQYMTAGNMTDAMAALSVLSRIECPQREVALQHFHDRWQHDALVMDKWFALQATSSLPDTLQQVQGLMQHPLFDLRNPNKVRALVGSFAMRNPLHFHAPDGSGYAFLTDRVLELDAMNPQIASRMVRPLMNWRQYETIRSGLMKAQLERIQTHAGLSGDVYEIVSKSLV
ncbi:MAG: aminopeptidase [Pseudomonadota bacterium]|jgi:aminopeptidase N|uniref:Aminopeptidase N n=1 Tax=Thiothrix fructosivorans TaxID=111770 RepID=A0A8B0SG09_9GAMM|nr:aminopeptidase N [Thiothrix fructosivorans]MBO0614910.1 aminopeptidase N [Thiothrix fructosivorans]QTX09719.1 aminopeptidase N [Thiothrix fructosivorans]